MSIPQYTNKNPTVTVAVPRAPQAVARATRSLAGTGTTDVLNTSNPGRLHGVFVRVTSAATSTPDAELRINIDGDGAVVVLPLYDGTANTWEAAAQDMATVGDGDATGDKLYIPLGLDFAASCVVQLVCGTAGGGELAATAVYSEDI